MNEKLGAKEDEPSLRRGDLLWLDGAWHSIIGFYVPQTKKKAAKSTGKWLPLPLGVPPAVRLHDCLNGALKVQLKCEAEGEVFKAASVRLGGNKKGKNYKSSELVSLHGLKAPFIPEQVVSAAFGVLYKELDPSSDIPKEAIASIVALCAHAKSVCRVRRVVQFAAGMNLVKLINKASAHKAVWPPALESAFADLKEHWRILAHKSKPRAVGSSSAGGEV